MNIKCGFVKQRLYTGLSCACRIVSKLNVRPFHKVNSPLLAPAITRWNEPQKTTMENKRKTKHTGRRQKRYWFSATCDQPTALWCPRKAENGASHLVCCSLDKPCEKGYSEILYLVVTAFTGYSEVLGPNLFQSTKLYLVVTALTGLSCWFCEGEGVKWNGQGNFN